MNNKKELLKKLLKDELKSNEQVPLIENISVDKHMRLQWEEAALNLTTDKQVGERIWKKIEQNMWQQKQHQNNFFYKIYSIAASFLLLISIGCMLHFISEKQVPSMYTINTGIQNIKQITLPDGTCVQMGPKSTLTYPDVFTGKQRLVKLSGQGYFEVAKDIEKPFIVEANNMEVTALGTAFEIFNYDNKDKTETILENGKVSVKLLKEDKTIRQTLILNPDDKLSFSKSDGTHNLEKVDAGKYTAWHKNRILTFENENLKNILPRLEEWFGRDIISKDETLNNVRFTFKVKDESLETILFLMTTTAKLKYEKQEEIYILTPRKK